MSNYPDAECIRVVQDNLSTHSPGALYEAFAPAEARRILRRLELHYPQACQLAQHGRDRDRRSPAANAQAQFPNSENSKANRIETMKGPAESGQICSVEVEEK
jgi:hypothetical protein